MSIDLINIWIATDESLDEFAAHLEQILNITFDPADIDRLRLNPAYAAYAFRDESSRRWLLIPFAEKPPSYLDDGDKLFSNYDYRIEISLLGMNGTAESYKIRSEWVNLIYEKLKATNRYPLMMVDGVHPKLAQFDPTPSA